MASEVINETKDYTYDAYGRLTKTVTTDHSNNNAESTVEYTYDSVGNRTTLVDETGTTTYTYNGLNQLVNKVDSTGTTTYSYDGRGNQIGEVGPDGSVEYAYSSTGEMVKVTSGSTVIQENEYNHEGIRISKTESGTKRQYIYDEGSVAYTLDNELLSTSNILGGYQNVIGSYRGEDYYTYSKDIQGSTSSITDSNFIAQAIYEYSDFGEVEEVVEFIDNEICYTGAIYDDTTGLYYMNARYYNPVNGRFISQDTYRGELNDPGQWHLYVYCANNPINNVDPSGHWVTSIGFKAEAAYVYGAYVMITLSFDGKNFLVSYSLGVKFMTNASVGISVPFAVYSYKSVDSLLGWGVTLGVNLVGKVSGSVSFDKNGNVGASASADILKYPKATALPFYFDFEFGYTGKIMKKKWGSLSKTKKYYSKYGQKVYVVRRGDYVEYGSAKYRLKGKFYKNGKVKIGK